MSKKCIFSYLHQEKVLCYTQFKMYITLKTHILTKSTNFCEKNLEIMKIIFLISMKKNNKTFCRNKFLCVLRSPWETSEHTKTFFGQIFYYFFHAYEKYICHNFKIFSQQFAGII